jgi:uncharacterized protein (TIGR00288 family)
MDARPRIAMLIDADNVTREGVTEAITSLETFGDVNIRRAYGDWFDARLKRWEPLLRSERIRSVQQFGYTKGKNATDMALVIDAVSLLYTERPDAFAIVSSDADFTPLVMHLRERGVDVFGYGNAKTPKPFRDACTRFTAIRVRTKAEAPATAATAPDAGDQLRKAVVAAQGKDGWARIQAVRAQLGPKASFNPSDYGAATLTKLLKVTGGFELKGEGSPAVMVRVADASQPEV